MTNKYAVRENCLKQIRVLKQKREKHTERLVKIMEIEYKDRFLKQQRIDEVKGKLLSIRSNIKELSYKVGRIK